VLANLLPEVFALIVQPGNLMWATSRINGARDRTAN
jgi:hypothetical protein